MFIDWNVDPFGQDVEHVLMDNILKYGDDPTMNQRDQASTTNWIIVFLIEINKMKKSETQTSVSSQNKKV